MDRFFTFATQRGESFSINKEEISCVKWLGVDSNGTETATFWVGVRAFEIAGEHVYRLREIIGLNPPKDREENT